MNETEMKKILIQHGYVLDSDAMKIVLDMYNCMEEKVRKSLFYGDFLRIPILITQARIE